MPCQRLGSARRIGYARGMHISDLPLSFLGLAAAAFFAGAMNALAGGGSFITFPALLLTGLDPRAANITNTVALFPGQIASGWAGRHLAQDVGEVSFTKLIVISVAGGVVGALLLLATPPSFFAALVPYLVLFATLIFAWGSFGRKQGAQETAKLPARPVALIQFAVGIYGGYFGGGMGFVMLAVLSLAGVAVRNAGAMKNVFASVINFAAALVFFTAPDIAWIQALIVAVAASLGGLSGVWLLRRIPERVLRITVVLIGLAVTVAMILKA